MEKGKGSKSALEEIKDLYGFETNAIVSMKDVTSYLHGKEINGRVLIDDDMMDKINAYYKEYGAEA